MRWWRIVPAALTALGLAAAVAAVGVQRTAAAPAAKAAPATFLVGAAVGSIDPDPGVPLYSGGFGYSPPVTQQYAPLEVRAFYVSNGRHAAAIAVVDSQAYFAAYQEGPDFGITSVRDLASAQMSKLEGRPAMDRAAIIVQGTHSHSAATLEGIWGPVPPTYLKKVHDRTVTALVDAARQARPAHLQWSSIWAPDLDNIVTAQTDSYAGWTQDGQVSVLRALDPHSGATVATFASVPAHPDIVNGAGIKQLGADYFGPVRDDLQAKLGGIAVVGPATLGREETFVQVGGLGQMGWYAGVVENRITEALTHAHWVTDPTIAGSETLVTVPGDNAALLGLVVLWSLPDQQKAQLGSSTGLYPIDRSITPPYLIGNTIGTYVTALRIGGVGMVSMPGEPFPEIRLNVLQATQGIDMLVGLSKGQDDLGYWYPAWVTPFTAIYHSDHLQYNVAVQAGDQFIQSDLSMLHAVGFATTPGIPAPLPTDWQAAFRSGLQALASPGSGDAGPAGTFSTTLQAAYSNVSQPYDASPVNLPGQPQIKGEVQWDLGDGSTSSSHAVRDGSGASWSSTQFTHGYAPGDYTVRLRAQDTAGNSPTWTLRLRVYPRLVPSVSATRLATGLWRLSGAATGGDGVPLAWRWSFSDGGAADGRVVTHRFAAGTSPAATLRVVDGTDSVAQATWPVAAAGAHNAAPTPASGAPVPAGSASHPPAAAAGTPAAQNMAADRLAASTLGHIAGGAEAAPAVTAGGLTVLGLAAVRASRRRTPRGPR
jgi:hypothetical protein